MAMTVEEAVRAFVTTPTARGLSAKAAQWRAQGRVSDEAFVQALNGATAGAEDGGTISRVYALHIDCGANGGRKVKLVVGEDALARAREACAGKGEVVRATTTRGATRDGTARGMFEDERTARMEYYDAQDDEMNAFRGNVYGRVQMSSVERRSGAGRRAGATTATSVAEPAKKATPTAATTTATATKKDTKDTNKTKDTAVPAKKSSTLMSMFAKAPPKKTPAPELKKQETTTATKKIEEEKPAVSKKVAASAEAAILEVEEDASDEDSDDDLGVATRKPRRKRAMAVDSEDDDEDEQPTPEGEEEEEEEEDADADAVMEIEDEPTPAPTPSPKKTPGSSKKTTPASSKRKSEAQGKADENEDDEAPSSNPTSACKKQKKDKPLSKKALLARRIKKTIEIMDEETGEEITSTIFVDEFENELNEDGSYKYPENVKTAANA